eukprot:TRINITY_DN9057_c0_g1_i1.p1 TRINITY_DN9057_c0_g1~~TRINITY_DN9057_c0_g1_i1.p1  ORF type:complete len:883 (-),score=176.62 TRINITY_DN9057_c0_g1_i1:97-2664(-)
MAIQRQGTVHFVALSIFHSFQIFNCEKLTLVFVGEQFERKIDAIAMAGHLTFVATNEDIHVCHRAKTVSVLSGHEARVNLLLPLGDFLLSISEDNRLNIWNYRKANLFAFIDLPDYFHPTVIMHPDTYLNKIIVGSQEGLMQLWNIRKRKLIYSFDGWGSEITCIEQSPAVDVVGIGLKDGRIILHNLKLDKTIFIYEQDGAVTSLSFRTDGQSFLASSDKNGSVFIWDLNSKRLHTELEYAHTNAISSIHFFRGEPILLTTGLDNSIRMWIFDGVDGEARLLRERSGHSKPPTKIKFYVSSSMLMSAGNDKSFRIFSTVKDQRSRELSQGNIQNQAKKLHTTAEYLKLPPIIDYSANRLRQREWDNMVTAHKNHYYAYSWNKENWRKGDHKFKSTSATSSHVTAVCISECGNFAIIGSKNGWIDKYNIQSGKHRGVYVDINGHTQAIQSVHVNQLNTEIITTSIDGTIKFWDFKLQVLRETIEVGSPITKAELSKESEFLAVTSDDLVIRIYDIVSRKMIRIFKGHKNLITDIAFNGDARWLASADGNSEVRIWDLPSGRCIDWFKMKTPVTSLDFTPRSDFLATTHVGSNGIYLWANAYYFSNVFLKPIPDEPKLIQMPKLAGPDDSEESEESLMEQEGYWEDLEFKDYLDEELITLSREPTSKWSTLVNLEVIKERNKVKKPLEKPQLAPFHLDVMLGLENKFAPIDDELLKSSAIINMGDMNTQSKFVTLLADARQTNDYTEVLNHLKSLSPSGIDFTLKSLSYDHGFEEFILVLNFILEQLKKKQDFELVQAVLNVILKEHGEIMAENELVLSLCEEIEAVQSVYWTQLQDMFNHNICLISYFTDTFDQL